MAAEITCKQTSQEVELLNRREAFAAVRIALAGRELEGADFHAQLKSFEAGIPAKSVFCISN